MKKVLFILYVLGSLSLYSQQYSLHAEKAASIKSTNYYGPGDEFLYWIFSEITYGILIESIFERDTPMHDAQITPYPYFSGNEGNYTYDGEAVPFRIEAGSTLMFDNRMHFTGSFSAKLRFAQRLDVQAGYMHLLTDKGRKKVSQTDFVLNYHRIRTRRLDFWYGLGVVFSKYTEDDTGLVVNLGTELFLGKKIGAESLIKWDIFENASGRHTGFQINYYLSRWRLQAGVHNYKYLSERTFTLQCGIKYYF